MSIIKGDAQFHTDLYVKPTDSNKILCFDSVHPKHSRESIPFRQFLRLRRICSDTHTFIQQALTKAKQFLQRDYPKDRLIWDLLRAALRDQKTLLQDRPLNDGTNLEQQVLVTSFHPALKGLCPIVNANWDI